MVRIAKLSYPTPPPNQQASTSSESMSLYRRVGSPVACSTSAANGIRPSQCRNGANVTTVSSTIWPPTAMPMAVGVGRFVSARSAAHAATSSATVRARTSGDCSEIAWLCGRETMVLWALMATALARCALILTPTNVRASWRMRSAVCGRPRRSRVSALSSGSAEDSSTTPS